MTRLPALSPRTLAAIAALVVIAAVAVWGFWPRGDGNPVADTAIAATPTGTHQHAVAAQSATPSPGAASPVPVVDAPATAVGSHRQGSLLAAASVEPTGERTGAPTGGERADVDPTDIVDPSAALGGCLPAYGTDGQCLATYPPSASKAAAAMGMDPADMPHGWGCRELRQEFPKGIAVRQRGVDPQKLDTDADGVACDQDD